MGIFTRQEIDKANARIEELTGSVTAKDDEIANLKSQLSTKDGEISKMTAARDEAETAKAEAEKAKAEAEKAKADAEAATAKAEAELETEKKSASAKLRSACAQAGIDPEDVQAIGEGEGSGDVPEKTWKQRYDEETDPVAKGKIFADHADDIYAGK